MGEVLRWVASDTAVRPRVALTRDGAAIDLSAASQISIQFQRVVASGVTPLMASFGATVPTGLTAAEGIVESITYGSAPLATKGQYRQQVRIVSAAGVETFQTPFTVMLGEKF